MTTEAIGPEQIRAGFAAVVASADERAAEFAGIAATMNKTADWYAQLRIADTTITHIRAAADNYTGAQTALRTVHDNLEAALTDFNTHDGLVADAATATGNLAGAEILTPDAGSATTIAFNDSRYLDRSTVVPSGTDPQNDVIVFEPGHAVAGDDRQDDGAELDELDEEEDPAAQAWGSAAGITFDDGRYLDWSTVVPSGTDDPQDDVVVFELGNDKAATNIDLTRAEIGKMHQALTITLLEHAANEQPPNTTISDLLAVLTTYNPGGFWSSETDSYVLWVNRTETDKVEFQVGDGTGPAGYIEMTWAELTQLHRQVTDTFRLYEEQL